MSDHLHSHYFDETFDICSLAMYYQVQEHVYIRPIIVTIVHLAHKITNLDFI